VAIDDAQIGFRTVLGISEQDVLEAAGSTQGVFIGSIDDSTTLAGDDVPMNEARLGEGLDLSLLSPRETEVLDVAVQGLSARDIARRLSLTEATVRSHLSATYSKLGVSGRVELLARMHGAAAGDRGSHPSDGDNRGLQTDGNRAVKPMVSLRSLSMWAYMLSFGALFGYATYGYTITNIDGTTDTGMIFVWVVMALVGSALIGLKNRRIGDRRLRARINVTDLAVLMAALALIAVLPGFIGMLKGIVLLALFAPYAYWYFATLKSAGLD
jgi:DNA-binding CsgD family transcriptional regulator